MPAGCRQEPAYGANDQPPAVAALAKSDAALHRCDKHITLPDIRFDRSLHMAVS